MFPFTTELLWARRLGGQEWRSGYNATGGKRRDEDAECHSCISMALPMWRGFHGHRGCALRFARNASERNRFAIFRNIRNQKRPRRFL